MKNTYHINTYENGEENQIRFALGNIKGVKPLFGLGLNPSTGDEKKSNMTIAKVKGFAARNGFDGFLILNLYPLRAIIPDDLPEKQNTSHYQLNLKAINKQASALKEINILASWGNPILKRKYLKESLQDIKKLLNSYKVNWWQIGEMTKQGHPRHPSRASYNAGLLPFDIDNYLESFQ